MEDDWMNGQQQVDDERPSFVLQIRLVHSHTLWLSEKVLTCFPESGRNPGSIFVTSRRWSRYVTARMKSGVNDAVAVSFVLANWLALFALWQGTKDERQLKSLK
jgi:hypothetical protein